MSGLDYTKKTELRNGLEEGGVYIAPKGDVRQVNKILLWWYRFSFLRRTRGERWIVYFCFLVSIVGISITFYTLLSINTPVPVQLNCPK